jgi:hypothetical protein
MKDLTLSPQLALLVEQMSRDMAVPVEGLVNQAIFNWARLHGYLEPTPLREEAKESTQPPTVENHLANEPMPSLGPPDTRGPTPSRAMLERPEPVTAPHTTTVPEPDDHVGEMKAPSIKRLRRVFLVVQDREVPVNEERFILGRDVTCHLTVEAPRISRQHAALLQHPDGVTLQDLNSSNGTWFDGQRITEHELASGDEFFLGDVPVRVEFR